MKHGNDALSMGATEKRVMKRKLSNAGRKVDKDSDADLIFNNFEFSVDNAKKRKLTYSKTSAETMLSRVQQVKERLNDLRGTREGQQLGNDFAWKAALERAAGGKVHDDPEKLKKTIKRTKKAKEKSRENWARFQDAVDKAKAEGTPIPDRVSSKPKQSTQKKRKRRKDPAEGGEDKKGKGGKGAGKGGKEGKGGKGGGKEGKGGKGGGKEGKGGKGSKGGKGGKGSKGDRSDGDDGAKKKKTGPKTKAGKIERRMSLLKEAHKKVKIANKQKKKTEQQG
ncbi:Ribosomal RNA-processing protein 14 [Diplonema papillatum]|nr:Ribosomal RNA-processing protein 14 [Diplonema papillatum]